MKFLFDFFPIALFFVAYKMYDIYVATAVAIIASFIQVGWYWLQNRRFEKMHIITLGLITVLGGMTLALQDETFIKWKPTIVNWLFAIAFFGSQFIGEKPIVQRMMGSTITMPDEVWHRLSSAWSIFFVTLGFINLYVAYNFDTDTWVNFKMFGLMGLTFAFIIGQAFFLSKYMQPEEEQTAETKSEKES